MSHSRSHHSLYEQLCGALAESVGPIVARSVVGMALRRCGLQESTLERTGVTARMLEEMRRGLEWYCRDRRARQDAVEKLKTLGPAYGLSEWQEPTLVSIEIAVEEDILVARNRARVMAQQLGFNHTDQIKIATAVSEVARNIFRYAATGRVIIAPLKEGEPGIIIEAKDEGPGIDNIQQILSGSFRSDTGMGLGLSGCRNLMDEFSVLTSGSRGTHIKMKKRV